MSRVPVLFVWLIAVLLLGFAASESVSTGVRDGDESGGESGGADSGGASEVGESSAPGGPSGGPKKRPDWLAPVLPQTVAVPKEPSDEKAIRLIQQMKKPWEGMEDPRLTQTEEGMRQSLLAHAKQSGEALGKDGKPSNAGDTVAPAGDAASAEDIAKAPKRRAVVPQLPPIHLQRTLLWDPSDILRDTRTSVSSQWDRDGERKLVESLPYHPLRLFSERVNPTWNHEMMNMHNQRYRKKFKENKGLIPPDMRLNPPFFPHVVAHYTDRVPSSDLNANPVEWPVQPRYLGEKPHGPYDSYHDNPDRYMAPMGAMTWRETQKARPGTIWPQKVHFPKMPAPGDTYDQLIELSTSVDDADVTADAEEDEDVAEDADAAEVDDEVDAEDDSEDADADADSDSDAAEEDAEDAEELSFAEAAAEADLTPEQMYWYWVQPYKGKDRFGRDGRLYTPPYPRHPMFKYGPVADAATGHSRKHYATSPKPTFAVDGVSVQHSEEPFDTSAALPLADLQRKLDINKENPAKAARALLNDDRAPYLFSDGKQDEADYKMSAGPTKAGNKYDAIDKANAKKAAAASLAPFIRSPEGDLVNHPNFPYASWRKDYLGQVRGFKMPAPQPALKYEHIKAGTKADFPVSYGGEQKEKPKAAAAFLEESDELDAEDEADAHADDAEDVAEDAEDAAEEEEDMSLLQMRADEMAPHARAHIPAELHGDAPAHALSHRAVPRPIRLNEHGEEAADEEEEESDEEEGSEEEEEGVETIALETRAHADSDSEHDAEADTETEAETEAHTEVRVLTPAEKKPWWATKAGRTRNAMSEPQRRALDRRTKQDAAHVLDQPMFRQAYSGPVDLDKSAEQETTPRAGAAALLDSLAALARNPLSDAPNLFAGQPKSAADRAMASQGINEAMEMGGVDPNANREPDANSETVDMAGAGAPDAGGMRFQQQHTAEESPAKFDANFDASKADEHEQSSDAAAAGDMRFAQKMPGGPKEGKEAQTGYGVGLRGMILTQDAAIIAGPNRYRSPTLVNPYSIAAANGQLPAYGAGAAPYPYNYPYGPNPAAAPGAPSYPGPRGVPAKFGGAASGAAPTTVVNIYGASGAVSTSAGAGAAPKGASPYPPTPSFGAIPSIPPPPAGRMPVGNIGMPLPYGDTFPPSMGPYPPPLSGLMDVAASMHNRVAPGMPPAALFGHPFQKVPVPQFPPSSPTVPYPRYPMGPQGALSETGWQKPRLIPIVYGTKA